MGIRITEKKKVIVQCCEQYPVILSWLNALGAYETFVFGFDRTHSIETAILAGYQKYQEELANSQGWQEVLQKRNIPKMAIGVENINIDTCNGLRIMLESVRVQMQTNPTTWKTDGGPKWITVTVLPGTFMIYKVRDGYGNVRFEIQLQEELVQQQ